jgi:cob(I)alamin adenosyltransferase
MKIYTKRGDKGQTSLGSGIRVPKYHIRVETYGTIDELNSIIGIIVSFLGKTRFEKDLAKTLEIIQNDLFNIGSYLASPAQRKLLSPLPDHVSFFEKEIDEMMKVTPVLLSFILPGGTQISSFLHLARTVSRRAERHLVELNSKEEIDSSVLVYINRLSDLFFAMARYVNFKNKRKDIPWNHD